MAIARRFLLAVLITLALAVAFAFASGAALAAPATVVRVLPEAVVERDDVTLGDIATIEGDAATVARLGALRIGPAPVAGASHRLDADALRLRLRWSAADAARVQLEVPGQVVITRSAQVVPGGTLVEAVRREALRRLMGRVEPGQAPGSVSLVPTSPVEDLKVPTGELALDVQVSEPPPGSTFLTSTVVVRVNGRDHRTLALAFRVGRFRPVVVAARPLEPRTVLGADDFRIETRPSTELPPDALAELPDPADLESLRPVRAGEIVTSRVLNQKLLVRRGEIVTLLLEGLGFRITTAGQVREDARRGDTVRVLNIASKREVLGQAEGPGVVRVPFREARSR